MKNKGKDLTIDELLKYNQLKKDISWGLIVILILFYWYSLFYLALLNLVIKLGLGLDYSKIILDLMSLLGQAPKSVHEIIFISIFVYLGLTWYSNHKLKQQIINER